MNLEPGGGTYVCVSWRPHSWFARSRAMGKQVWIAGIQASIQCLILFDHAFCLGDSPGSLRTLALMEQIVLCVVFQCALWHSLDCTSRRAYGRKRFSAKVWGYRVSGETDTIKGDPEVTRVVRRSAYR